jgi:hypothetical protein
MRWMIARHPLTAAFTTSGGNLIAFDLTIRNVRGKPLDQYETIYMERPQ